MSEHLILIDGSAFIHRAFHSFPRFERKSDGVNIGAVNGFCEMLWATLERSLMGWGDRPATHIAVIFDHKSSNFRHRLFPAYKANRPPVDPELREQLPIVRRAAKAFGMYQLELEGHEADDIMATIAIRMAERTIETTILSSDKDLMQLIGPFITMWDPMKKVRIDADAVYQKFDVWPSELGDYLAIIGDNVDNIPGLYKVGPKGAADLIHQFGNIETMIARQDEIAKPSHLKALAGNEEQLRISRKLVELDTAVPVTFDLDQAVVRWPKKFDIIAFLRSQNLETLWMKIAKRIEENPQPRSYGKMNT